MSRRQARAIIGLFAISVSLTILGMFALFHYVHEVSIVARKAEAAQLAADRATSVNAAERCASLQHLASIPIPTPYVGHESRQFARQLEMAYRARARQLGCKVTR